MRAIAHGLELDVWIWDGETNDWSLDGGANPATIQANYQNIMNGANNAGGTIVLTHELSLAVTAPFIRNFAALNNAFTNGVVGAHICANVTRPWAEPNAPVLPRMQHYIAGARTNNGNLPAPVSNLTAAVYFAGMGALQNGPDFIDAAAIASSAAAAVPSSTAASSSSAATSSTPISASPIAAVAGTSATQLSTSAVVGIAAGSGVAGLILLILAVVLIIKRQRAAKTRKAALAKDAQNAAQRGDELQRLSYSKEGNYSSSTINEKPGFGSTWSLPMASQEHFFADMQHEPLPNQQEHLLPPGAGARHAQI